MRPLITVRTLGPPEVMVDGSPAPKELLWKKNLALLVYLARSPKRRRSREQLAALLWGERPESTARHSLNEALRVIRHQGGESVIIIEGDQVAISAETVKLDVEELESWEPGADRQRAEDLIGGEFLEGFGVPGSNEFEDWLYAERQLWRQRSQEVLVSCAEACLDRGDIAGARACGRRAEALDSLADSPVQVAMRCAALSGDRAAALEVYEGLAERLQRELGVEPNEETGQLADRIRRQREWRLPAKVDATRRPPLVGREQELQRATGALRRCAAESSATMIIVQGDTGAGKTRVCQEIASRAALEHFELAKIRCVPQDLGVQGSGLAGLRASAVLADAPGETFVATVRAAAQQTRLLLWIDNAEYLDPESVQTLGIAMRDLADLPVTVVLAAASQPPREELDSLAARAGRDVPGEVIALQALSVEHLHALARHALPEWDEEPLERIARRLHHDSAGLPMIATELLGAVCLGLELGEPGEVWPQAARTLEQTLPGPVPASLVAALRIGFRRLSPDSQELLKVASLVEGRATAAALGTAAQLDGDALLAALDELEWQRWLAAEPRGYTFVAGTVQDVIAQDMLTKGQRQRILERLG